MFAEYEKPLADKHQEKMALVYYKSDLEDELLKLQSEGLSADAIDINNVDLLARRRWFVHQNYQKILGIEQISSMLTRRFGEQFTPLISKINLSFVTEQELVKLKIEIQKLGEQSQNKDKFIALLTPIIDRPEQMRKELEEAQQRLLVFVKLEKEEARLRQEEIRAKEAAEQRLLEEAELRKIQDEKISILEKMLSEAAKKSTRFPEMNENEPLVFSGHCSQKRARDTIEKDVTEKIEETLTETHETSDLSLIEAKKLKGRPCWN